MIAFKQHFQNNLAGKTFQDTADAFHGQLDQMTFSLFTFLQDIGSAEGRRYTEDAARMLKDILLDHYPNTRWSALLAVHSGILNGSIEIKSGAIGAITRLLNKTTGQNLTPYKDTFNEVTPEAIEHRQAYIQRFPSVTDEHVDTPCSMDAFLAMHPAGTFPELERMSKAEAISSRSPLEILRQRMSA